MDVHHETGEVLMYIPIFFVLFFAVFVMFFVLG